MIYRCFVEKRKGFDAAAKAAQAELRDVLHLPAVRVRLFNRYDAQGIAPEAWPRVLDTVLSEPMRDTRYENALPRLSKGAFPLYIEPLPGQFDARAESCGQCIQMLCGGGRPLVRTARVYVFTGIDADDFARIKKYLINPVEEREADAGKPERLQLGGGQAEDEPRIDGFIGMDADALGGLLRARGLSMSLADLRTVRHYFNEKAHDPTLTELRVIDTYWSDHCRHTTFNTEITEADIQDERARRAYDLFVGVNEGKPVTLMRIATAATRHLRGRGGLPMLDESEENNACTVRVAIDTPRGQEDWLLFFKNETHNHPTEIEPYGGASTCIGGAIRDPLSGRAYVYQSMRISGAGDPRAPLSATLPGKLPQRRLTVTAAAGFSAYGNQIGIATGYVKELYHPGYTAKRLETGAVVGAAKADAVRRERPVPGDVVVLLGGRTGRDGIGGATGSSKTHNAGTVADCAAEVQKGNAPEERKLQRLFRNPEAARLIKKCNDFGAGGVAVAIGELADGVEIDLDTIPLKYDGLSGTEIAISESQERMAVVVAPQDAAALLLLAAAENVEATVVARITEQPHLVMTWRGRRIADISRAFLDTNGAARQAAAYIPSPAPAQTAPREITAAGLLAMAAGLDFCSQKGLVERFDHSIGAASVFMPYGGRFARTETQVMAALLPAPGTTTASVMAYGGDPYFTEADPFGGAAYAVTLSAAKLVAAGVDLSTAHLSLQEYFPRVNDDPARWGRPLAAMLGAFAAQMGLGLAAIGGKDSMYGSFGELDVPPTLISFAVGVSDASTLISPAFKQAGHKVYLLHTPTGPDGLPDYAALRDAWERYTALCRSGKVRAAWACEAGGLCGGLIKMAFGNNIGFKAESDLAALDDGRLWGAIIFATDEAAAGYTLLGRTQAQARPFFTAQAVRVSLRRLHTEWEAQLETVFPVNVKQAGEAPLVTDPRRPAPRRGTRMARPTAVIPVFPGTNCEYDTARAVERAGGISAEVLIRNLTPEGLADSVAALEKAIRAAQMIIFPGGFSGGDEPDGSGKFIVSLFRNPRLADAAHDLLYNRDGLILGICNGFQALVKLGLLPGGRVSPVTAASPTLTFNRIGRHQSRYVYTRAASVFSPWLAKCEPGAVYAQPVSHGEGRFAASKAALEDLRAKGQIAFQYTDEKGIPAMHIAHNPNGSAWAIEGITSPDGRVLGKMAHTERWGEHVARNVPGETYLPLFAGGVYYFG